MSAPVQITLVDYFTGPDGTRRDVKYKEALTAAIYDNAVRTVEVVNAVLTAMHDDGVEPALEPATGAPVASGWRPPAVNSATSNAADHSRHLTGQACDIHDTPARDLARWAVANEEKLRECGVEGIERPAWCPTWLHVQTVAAGSGHFSYVPSTAPAKVAALPGEVTA